MLLHGDERADSRGFKDWDVKIVEQFLDKAADHDRREFFAVVGRVHTFVVEFVERGSSGDDARVILGELLFNSQRLCEGEAFHDAAGEGAVVGSLVECGGE